MKKLFLLILGIGTIFITGCGSENFRKDILEDTLMDMSTDGRISNEDVKYILENLELSSDCEIPSSKFFYENKETPFFFLCTPKERNGFNNNLDILLGIFQYLFYKDQGKQSFIDMCWKDNKNICGGEHNYLTPEEDYSLHLFFWYSSYAKVFNDTLEYLEIQNNESIKTIMNYLFENISGEEIFPDKMFYFYLKTQNAKKDTPYLTY